MDDPIVDVQLRNEPVKALGFDPFPQPAGAECVFVGRTRRERHEQHGQLVRLSYDAYVPMAQRVLRDLADRAVGKFSCLAVRIHHAIGEVPLGRASVVVEVVCGHRDRSFEACRYLIDRLKLEAPIWKREEWEDGTTWSSGTTPEPEESPA